MTGRAARNDKSRKELKRLLDRFLVAREIVAAGNASDPWYLEYTQTRQAVIQHLVDSPLPVITAQRMHERFGPLIRQHVVVLEFDDLLSIAHQAVVKIVDDFDPTRGHTLQFCAIQRMRQAIYGQIRKMFRGGRAAMTNIDNRVYTVSIDEELDPSGESMSFSDILADDAPSAWVELQRSEVRHAVEELPEGYRDTVRLLCFEERGVDETARILGVTADVVKDRRDAAFAVLRDRLVDYEDGFS